MRLSGDDLCRIVLEIVTPCRKRRGSRALVVKTPEHYGVARQYQVYAEHYSRDQIFRDLDAALTWLLKTSCGALGRRSRRDQHASTLPIQAAVVRPDQSISLLNWD